MFWISTQRLALRFPMVYRLSCQWPSVNLNWNLRLRYNFIQIFRGEGLPKDITKFASVNITSSAMSSRCRYWQVFCRKAALQNQKIQNIASWCLSWNTLYIQLLLVIYSSPLSCHLHKSPLQLSTSSWPLIHWHLDGQRHRHWHNGNKNDTTANSRGHASLRRCPFISTGR